MLDPLLSVITNVSLDHVERLGHTITAIAEQKAGIIKPGRPVVTAARHPEALAVIEATAAAQGSPLWRLGREFSAERHGFTKGGQRFSVQTPVTTHRDLQIPLAGAFQVENAATAVAALDCLATLGEPVGEDALRRGLAAVRIPGRLEVLRRRPTLSDRRRPQRRLGRALAQALAELTASSAHPGAGRVGGPPAADVVAALAPRAAVVIANAADNPRALDPEQVAAAARQHTAEVRVVTPVAAAVREALALAGPDDVICVTGSFFVIAEVERTPA